MAVAPTPTAGEASQGETLKNARLGFDSVLETCSISTVVVSEDQNGYCRVYVNLEDNPTQPGWNVWGEGEYKPFLRGLFNKGYKNVKIRRGTDGKISLRFSDKQADGPVVTKIVFVSVAKKPAAETAVGGSNTLHLPKK